MRISSFNFKISEAISKHFKIGDMVECVNPPNFSFLLKKGKKLKIKNISNDGSLFFEKEHDNEYVEGVWMANRFKLIKE